MEDLKAILRRPDERRQVIALKVASLNEDKIEAFRRTGCPFEWAALNVVRACGHLSMTTYTECELTEHAMELLIERINA